MAFDPLLVVGLVVALAGFRLRAAMLDAVGVGTNGLLSHASKWLVPAALLAIAATQGLTPADLGWRVDSPVRTLGRVAVGLVVLIGSAALASPVYDRIGSGNDELEAGMADLADTSAMGKVFVGATAGATEEVAYNGYALERLAVLTGNPPLAGAVTATAFVLGHWGDQWSLSAVLRIAQPAILVTGMYLYWRSLPVLIAIHALNDILGLFLAPEADDAEGSDGVVTPGDTR
ncbi:CPBP family intramembrane metalloprotease [Halobacteriales archaeon QS_6_71_20]|nr:MAG: CPBP family intramembrane metalloprotease [Halobacteriales archaeon QS_6_71_20]